MRALLPRRQRVLGATAVSLATLLTLSALGAARSAPKQQKDPWLAVRFLEGTWVGTSKGEPGEGTVERTYAFALKNRYLHERNVSTYPPQAANPKGEVHEHWSFISHDRARDALVMRQFHQEGFVNQFVFARNASSDKRLVFESESFENFSGWRGRETYDLVSNDEFVETFELGQLGKEMQVYSRNRFKRAKRQP